MTIRKKQSIVLHYCLSESPSKNGCTGCVLRGLEHNWKLPLNKCLQIGNSDEEDLDRAIKLIQESKDLDKAHDVNKLAESVMSNDNVNHPKHYQGKNECIDVMVAMFGVEAVKHFCMCNAYKYRFRSNMKNGDEDIKKAEWYEDKLIELKRGGGIGEN